MHICFRIETVIRILIYILELQYDFKENKRPCPFALKK
jgi:hypothetical protein